MSLNTQTFQNNLTSGTFRGAGKLHEEAKFDDARDDVWGTKEVVQAYFRKRQREIKENVSLACNRKSKPEKRNVLC